MAYIARSLAHACSATSQLQRGIGPSRCGLNSLTRTRVIRGCHLSCGKTTSLARSHASSQPSVRTQFQIQPASRCSRQLAPTVLHKKIGAADPTWSVRRSVGAEQKRSRLHVWSCASGMRAGSVPTRPLCVPRILTMPLAGTCAAGSQIPDC